MKPWVHSYRNVQRPCKWAKLCGGSASDSTLHMHIDKSVNCQLVLSKRVAILATKIAGMMRTFAFNCRLNYSSPRLSYAMALMYERVDLDVEYQNACVACIIMMRPKLDITSTVWNNNDRLGDLKTSRRLSSISVFCFYCRRCSTNLIFSPASVQRLFHCLGNAEHLRRLRFVRAAWTSFPDPVPDRLQTV